MLVLLCFSLTRASIPQTDGSFTDRPSTDKSSTYQIDHVHIDQIDHLEIYQIYTYYRSSTDTSYIYHLQIYQVSHDLDHFCSSSAVVRCCAGSVYSTDHPTQETCATHRPCR